ncbi:ankyrin repeat domain-containing protein [Flagellimonas amoyensis]|uniref:ankyrin repeat domain-containing protein n=1 Tax=Flagellimonas amoyensis TaxID=2169401 RepID=UPI003AAA6997
MNEGVSPNTADYDGRTPLHLAACENQLDVVKHLIGQGVHLFPKTDGGTPPWTMPHDLATRK